MVGYFVLLGFKSNYPNKKFKEITVERINIVEPDVKLKMVISNQTKQHPGMMDGDNIQAARLFIGKQYNEEKLN